MKYIHILDEFSLAGGGVRSVVSDVSQEMALRGLEVYIFTLLIPKDVSIDSIKKWAEEKGIHFKIIGNNRDSLLYATKNLRRILLTLSKEDECCLYMHLKKGVFMGVFSSIFLKNLKRVEVYHSGYMHYKLQSIICKPFIHHYLSVSKDAKKQLVEQFGADANKVTVAYNGVDLIKLREAAIDTRQNREIVRFLTIGRLAYPKNIELSVEAFANLVSKNPTIKAEYLIAGDGPDREVVENKSKGTVKFLGLINRDTVCSHLASADVVVFPSLWEGNSIALLEAIAVGVPLLVTDIPSFREVLGNAPLAERELYRPEPFGAVFHKDNVNSCEAAMEYLIKNNALLFSMKSYVSALADNYTLEKQCQTYIEIAKE